MVFREREGMYKQFKTFFGGAGGNVPSLFLAGSFVFLFVFGFVFCDRWKAMLCLQPPPYLPYLPTKMDF